MSLSIVRVPEEGKLVVAHLLQLCLHDCTEYDPSKIGCDGLFKYEWLDAYWTDAKRFPYLFRLSEEIVGFALVRKPEHEQWDAEIAEFFILRSHRRKKLGQVAARALLEAQSGVWEISYEWRNHPARAFWNGIVREYDPFLRPIPLDGTREHYILEIKVRGNANPSGVPHHEHERAFCPPSGCVRRPSLPASSTGNHPSSGQ